jgi:Na+-translocating ferredoxin:NAD+ oxidoreductase RnfG subunit
MKTIAHGSRSGGFVLLEVVLALGLFALVAVGMTGALNQIAQTSKLSRMEARVLRVLESVLAEAIHQPEIEPGSFTHPDRDDGVQAQVDISIARLVTQNQAELDGMLAVRAEAWIEDAGDRVMERTLETYVYAPHSPAF